MKVRKSVAAAVAAGGFDESLGIDRPTVARRTGRVVRCDEHARKGTGYGMCDLVLDESGQCPRASYHVPTDEI